MKNAYLFQSIIGSAKQRIWFVLNQYPCCSKIFKSYQLLGSKGFCVASENTDIVIEGFPRSANTFAYVAFKTSQEQDYNIAHHLHGISQIKIASKFGIPAIVLIRKPVEAISSYLLRSPSLNPEVAFRQYIVFYRKLIPLADGFIIGKFSEVIKDFNQILQKVNLKFGTNFSPFDNTPSNIDHCFEIIKAMDKKDQGKNKITQTTFAAPTDSRMMLKNKIIHKFSHDESFSPLIAQADRIYDAFLKKTNNQYPADY
jgi:hypothetical protein